MNALAGPVYIVTGVLMLAGAAKVLRPSPTATALRELSIPSPMLAARALGVFEIVIAGLAIAFGAPVLWALIAAIYAGFTLFILWALNGNSAVGSCGCFGHEDTPPTLGHATFNAAAAAACGLAVADPVRVGDFDGTPFDAVVLVALIGLGISLVVAALTSLPRTLALARGTAAPVVRPFALDTHPPTISQGPS